MTLEEAEKVKSNNMNKRELRLVSNNNLKEKRSEKSTDKRLQKKSSNMCTNKYEDKRFRIPVKLKYKQDILKYITVNKVLIARNKIAYYLSSFKKKKEEEIFCEESDGFLKYKYYNPSLYI